jgi:hypothetical protein
MASFSLGSSFTVSTESFAHHTSRWLHAIFQDCAYHASSYTGLAHREIYQAASEAAA